MFIANTNQVAESENIVTDPSDRLSSSTQAKLIHDVRLALRRSGHAELRSAEITANDGAVTISGRVPSFYLKQVAQELAKLAAPEHQICNQLNVCPLHD